MRLNVHLRCCVAAGLSYTTYRVYVSTVNKPKSAKMNSWQVTAMYGMKGSPLYVPAAFQNDPPYGADIGGLPSTLTTYDPSAPASCLSYR